MFRVLIIFGVKVVRLLRLLLRLKYVYMVDEFRVDFILLIIRIYYYRLPNMANFSFSPL